MAWCKILIRRRGGRCGTGLAPVRQWLRKCPTIKCCAPHPSYKPFPRGEDASLTGQGCVNRLRVESTETLVANDNHRQRAYAHTHQLLDSAGIARNVFLCEWDTFLRQILHRLMAGASTHVAIDNDLLCHTLSLCVVVSGSSVVLTQKSL